MKQFTALRKPHFIPPESLTGLIEFKSVLSDQLSRILGNGFHITLRKVRDRPFLNSYGSVLGGSAAR